MELENKQELKNFVERFFTNLKSDLIWEGNILKIDKVPIDFENFYGKKSPYVLVFDKEDIKLSNDSELITKGSTIIRVMTNYLESMGQTTLLKINFPNSEEEIKKFLKFQNCQVHSISKKIIPDYILRFTFSTSLQYLNEKEQIMNNLYVNREKVIDFNLELYGVSEGKKEEIDLKDIKNYYNLAKEKLKLLLESKTLEIGTALNNKLDKEINRITEHYSHQIKEIQDEIDKNINQLNLLEGQLKGSTDKNIEIKINKVKEHLKNIEKENKISNFEKEKEFFINDEIHKHSLNIQNKLINTTIIYYPIFKFSIFLKSQDAGRSIEVIYNPLKKELNSVNCETCSKELSELFLCSSGHISCSDCISKCMDCHRITCKKCFLDKCEICNNSLCKRCSGKCSICHRTVCKSHLKKDINSKREYCISCIKRCSICNEYVGKENLKKCPSCSKEFCSKCEKTAVIKSNGRTFCKSCSKECSSCGKLYIKDFFKMCIGCNYKDCTHLNKCSQCRKQLCAKLKR
jgi:hypothetical protein